MSFVTNANFLTRYDQRIVGQLCGDSGVELTYAELLTDPNLTQLIEDASGEVISFCARGEIYSEDILNGLTGISQAYLQRLTSDVTFYFIVLRRGLSIENYPQCKNAYETLEKLAEGRQIFDLTSNAEAGHAESPAISIEVIYQQNFLCNSVPYFPMNRWTIQQA